MRLETPRRRRHRKALERPFPAAWRHLLHDEMVHWRWLDDEERRTMEDRIRLFLVDHGFEWAAGLEPSVDIEVVVAAAASLLTLELDDRYYREVSSIIVYPADVVMRGRRSSLEAPGLESEGCMPISGQAMLHGPVLISWATARAALAHPERGRNTIAHEFAHKIDMASGSANGVPPMPADLLGPWEAVCSRAFDELRSGESPHGFLDPYGGTNRAEFFAVATETFFSRPLEMRHRMPDLYDVVGRFYRQDPAERERRWRHRHRT